MDEEFVLMSFELKMETKQNDWILNSGASNHMTNSLDGFKEMQTVHQKVTVGNGKKIAVVQSGMWEGYVKNANGKQQKVILEKVDYVPNLVWNLFSLTMALTNNWKTSGNKNGIQIRKGNWEIHFNKRVNGKTGFVFSTTFMTTLDIAIVMMNQERKKMTYKQAHLLLGHPSKEIDRE